MHIHFNHFFCASLQLSPQLMSKTMKSIVFLAVLSVLTNGLNALPTVADNTSADKTCKSCTSLVAFIHKLNTNQTNLLENAFVNVCNDYSSLPGQQTTQTSYHLFDK
ncbi:unnamed protein product [Medioppia subpectinata]|uniref:Uncharacterized protein n=1 Tax=Medioppia subpectinata TaxID=1979941 RepID=A0A7R9KE09_9ACAR|nr:unnamed protein product [Medioppia subpectinata]CAG2101643.1 unnamed protein product [Medioppia subpectinata]